MLPDAFLTRPVAHRGLHNSASGVPENSRAAVRAAIERGYGIEIDLQLTADDQAVVFHDYELDRLASVPGLVREEPLEALSHLRLLGSDQTVPSFVEVLSIVDGQVPLLVELKDEDGALGDNVGPLERAVAQALTGYAGPVAVMSFNPHSVFALQSLAPDVPRGLVTSAFEPMFWDAPAERLEALARIEDFDRIGASFVSHSHRNLNAPAIADLKARDVPILCWTVRSEEEEAVARQIADNVTFEGYFPATRA
ncbi:MAG: glycerophosphodiester phosphodiesterase family protein [Pseudomonadota bacterium]